MNNKIRYYRLEGKKIIPIDPPYITGKDIEPVRITKDEIGDSLISTVFLCIAHSFYGGKPVLFETMVLGGKLDMECDRYYTYDDAVDGHKRMVERVKNENIHSPR